MSYLIEHKTLFITLTVLVVFLVIVAVQVLTIIFTGKPVAVPDIPRTTQVFGKGERREFVVIGDSTSIGQGANYADGIATLSAEYLAKNHEVHLTNFGISGAVVSEVLRDQIQKAAELKPDIVLLAAGANDVTHLTSLRTIEQSMHEIISKLKQANPQVKIFITGSPDMSSVPRFAKLTRWVAGVRTKQVNEVMQKVSESDQVHLIPIASETGPYFSAHPELFAADLFHPLPAGYAVWMPVIIKSLKMENL